MSCSHYSMKKVQLSFSLNAVLGPFSLSKLQIHYLNHPFSHQSIYASIHSAHCTLAKDLGARRTTKFSPSNNTVIRHRLLPIIILIQQQQPTLTSRHMLGLCKHFLFQIPNSLKPSIVHFSFRAEIPEDFSQVIGKLTPLLVSRCDIRTVKSLRNRLDSLKLEILAVVAFYKEAEDLHTVYSMYKR